jgi:predicted helicase
MASINEVLVKLKTFENEKKKGDYFEDLVVWYLQNSPIYKNLINPKTICLFDDWDYENKWKVETGVDIVAETYMGDLWGIQAKGYQPETNLNIGEIRNWLNDTSRKIFKHRLLVSTTESITSNAENLIKGQEKSASYLLYHDLLEQDLNWPIDLKKNVKQKDKYTPRKYQKSAVDDVIESFKKKDKGKLIMPCGTGKTHTSLWVDEALKTNLTICLFPSLLLLKKTMYEWNAHSNIKFLSLPVCSDESITHNDEPNEQLEKLGLPATTDISEILSFLNLKEKKVIFATYQSSRIISKALVDNAIIPDLLVADEAHRTTGISKSTSEDRVFSICLDDDKFKCKKKLFMTATPRFLSPKLKSLAKEYSFEEFSMDNSLHYGETLHYLSFKKSIEDYKTLSDYRVEILTINRNDIVDYFNKEDIVELKENTYEVRNVASTIAAYLVHRDYKFNKFITFHNSVKSATALSENFQNILYNLGKNIPNFKFSKVLKGTQKTHVRASSLLKLNSVSSDDFAFLTNARCLSEGIDVPSLDGIIISEPRVSKIDIIQIVGRALRKHKDKKRAIIVVPLIIDENQKLEDQINKSNFKSVLQVIRALKSHDERLEEVINKFVLSKARGSKQISLEPYICFSNPGNIDERILEEISTRTLVSKSEEWYLNYGEVEKFVSEHNRLPKSHHGRKIEIDEYENSLGNWCGRQRTKKRKGELSNNQIDLMNKLKYWEWEERTSLDINLPYLNNFLEKNGHLLITGRTNTTERWVGQMRATYTNGIQDSSGNYTRITDKHRNKKQWLLREDVEVLENLHWTWAWNLLDFDWSLNFSLLKFLIEEEGHMRLPYDLKVKTIYGNCVPRAWISRQRSKWGITYNGQSLPPSELNRGRSYELTEERYKLLKSINFVFIDPNRGGGKQEPLPDLKNDYSNIDVNNFEWFLK